MGIYRISSREQLPMCGPPAWEVGDVLATPPLLERIVLLYINIQSLIPGLLI